MVSRAEYKREISRRWKEEGKCANCGARPPKHRRNFCENCLENSRKATQRFREKNPEAFKKRYHGRKKEGHCTNCGVLKTPPEQKFANCEGCRQVARRQAVKTKAKAIGRYGGICACCGESKLAFLTLDHINNDGTQRRKTGERGGGSLYRFLLNAPIDNTLQVLCWNCNLGKRASGVCPHKDNTYVEKALSHNRYERRKKKG